jgi:ribosomal protein S18 acetylase RimI-like enzyme
MDCGGQMVNRDNSNMGKVEPLPEDHEIPYNLLLLADETVEAIDKYITDSEIFILKKEDQIVALYVLQKVGNDEAEIKNIAVDEPFQGQGIGKFLLKDAACKAKERGFKTLIIGTGTADVAAKQLNLYQKEGFKVFDIKKDFFTMNYPEPIYENGKILKDMVMLKKILP